MNVDVIRAWKDAEYRDSLSEEQRAGLPQNPVGMLELDEAELAEVLGGQELPDTGLGGTCGRAIVTMLNFWWCVVTHAFQCGHDY